MGPSVAMSAFPAHLRGTVADDDARHTRAVADAAELEFADFYRDQYQRVARALAYTLGATDLAAEAADEAMTRAYQRWESVSGFDNPGGWVYRVGLNWARSAHRRLTRRWPFRPQSAVTQPALPDPVVQAALDALSAPLRSVVVCRLLLDWSVEQTAAALEVPPGTVKSRLHRALRILRPQLQAAADDEWDVR